jgi:predicted permease
MARADHPGELMQDVRYAMRTLGRAPAFTAAAVFTLVIGMAGTISMFALVEGVLFRPLPVRAEGALFVGWRALPVAGARHWPFTTAGLDLLRDESRLLEGVAGVGYNDPQPIVMVDRGEATHLLGARVTGEFFRVLGVTPLIGRTLEPDDDVAGAESALVITHALWQRRYGRSPDVLGRRVVMGGQPFTIVGVMPLDVDHPRHVEAWMTVTAMQATTSNPTAKNAMTLELDLLARLRPGVTALQAEAELRTLAPQLDAQDAAGGPQGLVPALQPFREFVIGDVRPGLIVLFSAVGLVLLIASANVSNLLLVRGEARMPEFAVRAALGAGRGRIIRQMLVESAVLALGAGAIALAAVSTMLPIVLGRVADRVSRGGARLHRHWLQHITS